MSEINISMSTATTDLPFARTIHGITERSLTWVIGKMRSGKAGVFYSARLFRNDHPKKADEIRAILQCAAARGLDLYITEIDDDWPGEDLDNDRISIGELLNILDDNKNMFH